MGFFAPWFFAGLAAAAAPVYFHLLRRHKSTPRPFSSLMFFERTTQSSIRHRRIRYWELLALRLSIVVLLALAFAGPYIMRTVTAAGSGRRLLITVVDASFSMRAGDRLERAKREALEVAGRLRPGDEGQAAALGARLEFLTMPTVSRAELAGAIRSIRPGDSRGSYGELARALRAMAETSRLPLDVHLFTDMQQTSMPPSFGDLQLPAGTRFELHPVARGAEPNFTVENVTAPPGLFQPGRARVQATIAGYGAPAARRRVTLAAGGKDIASQTVEVPAGGRATAEFLSLDLPYGFNRCEVRIDSADALPGDDRFLFAVERSDPRPVLFVQRKQGGRDLLYFQAALDASPDAAFRVTAVETQAAGSLDLARFAVVVLSDAAPLGAGLEESLKRYVRAGGAVLIAAGPATARARRIPVIEAPILETSYATRAGGRFQAAGYRDPSHPAVRDRSRFDGVKFYYAVKTDPGEARVAVSLEDGTPLLVERRLGAGKALLFASTFDNVSNDFPLLPAFVPFVEQAITYLGGVENRTSTRLVDSFIELRTGEGPGGPLEVIDPSGSRALSLEEAARTPVYSLAESGYYEIRRPGGRSEMVAVNADRREGDLSVVPPETEALWRNLGEPEAQAALPGGETRRPSPLWWYVMALALAAAMVESFVASRYLGVERETG
jgi:hypothetical protein